MGYDTCIKYFYYTYQQLQKQKQKQKSRSTNKLYYYVLKGIIQCWKYIMDNNEKKHSLHNMIINDLRYILLLPKSNNIFNFLLKEGKQQQDSNYMNYYNNNNNN